MINLRTNVIKQLPVDELALLLLRDLDETNAWNEHSYAMEAQSAGMPRELWAPMAEAFGWLRARGLIGRRYDQSTADAIFVTRAGKQVIAEGPTVLYAGERLQEGLHPGIERKARRQFLLGEYEQAVFVAMKAVEVRARKLSGLGDDAYGVDLMNKAFGPKGPLTDPVMTPGERDGVRSLFVGAYAVLRNPAGHRDVDYDDVTEAAEAVQVASLLMRILDRVEERLKT